MKIIKKDNKTQQEIEQFIATIFDIERDVQQVDAHSRGVVYGILWAIGWNNEEICNFIFREEKEVTK